MIAAGIFAVLAVGAILDVNLPSTSERGGGISSSEIVARGLAAVRADMARDLTGSDNVSFYSGTIKWRKMWWHAIWANSQENYTNLLIGPGYGFQLKNLVNYLRESADLRTPHNVFYYALGYSGWIGVLIFFALQAGCGVLLWRTYRLTGQSWGLAIWAAILTSAFFGNVMETPAGAIPFYLLIGLFVGPALAELGAPVRESGCLIPLGPLFIHSKPDTHGKASKSGKPFEGTSPGVSRPGPIDCVVRPPGERCGDRRRTACPLLVQLFLSVGNVEKVTSGGARMSFWRKE